jgi:hypothetical protein
MAAAPDSVPRSGASTHGVRRLRTIVVRRLAGPVALLLAVLATLALAGCGGDPAGGTPASPASGPPTDPGLSPEPVPSHIGSAPPGGPSAVDVYLLGGSSARECVVSNADWSAELSELAGTEVRAVDLGATNQSFTVDRRYVCNMAEGAKLVLIGVGLGRYTSPPPAQVQCDKKLSPPLQEALDGELEVEHRYSETRIQSDERKEQLLETWLAERYPLYRKNYAANRDEQEELLKECRERGFSAVLLELPMNVEIAGDDLGVPRERYTEDCRKLATKYQVPWISFVDELRLPNTSFYDLAHLVEPGRTPWQTRLSEELAPLLAPLVTGEQ